MIIYYKNKINELYNHTYVDKKRKDKMFNKLTQWLTSDIDKSLILDDEEVDE